MQERRWNRPLSTFGLAVVVLLLAAGNCNNVAVNTPPTADAGADQTVAVGATATLSGSGDDADGDTLSYSWSFDGRPAGSAASLSGANQATATFTADAAGDFVVTLTVADGSTEASDSVTVTAAEGPFQEAKLEPDDIQPLDKFGQAVDIDGDFAIVGSVGNDTVDTNSGAAYIFSRTGSTWSQDQKLVASDGEQTQNFGWSVAIGGDYAIVGNQAGIGNEAGTGAAYLFERGPGGVWSEVDRVFASDGVLGDSYGDSVDISGEYAIVGTDPFANPGPTSGAAYVYQRNGGSWDEMQKLTASDGANADIFGTLVAISGDTVIVGAHFDDENGNQAGAAYLFRR